MNMLPPTLDTTTPNSSSNVVLQPVVAQMRTENSMNYLYKYLFECPDAYARQIAVKVFTACMKALAVHSCTAGAVPTAAALVSYNLLQPLIATILNMLQDVPLYSKQCEEVFLLIKHLALAHPLTRGLLEQTDVGVAVSLFLSKQSSSEKVGGVLFPRIYHTVRSTYVVLVYCCCKACLQTYGACVGLCSRVSIKHCIACCVILCS
jgi:hypothetical protein